MAANPIGFLGGGRIVRIILGGWQRVGFLPPEVHVREPRGEALAKLKSLFPAVCDLSDAPEALGRIKSLFVAVPSSALSDVLKSLNGHLRNDALVISLVPGTPLASLSVALGDFTRLARVVPNAPSLVGAGFNPVSFGPGLDETDREQVLSLLRPLGVCPVVSEKHLEAYAVLTAMGPTYFWFQFHQLRELGLSFGLAPSDLEEALAAMLNGSVQTFFASGLPAEEVMDLVAIKPLRNVEDSIREAYKSRLCEIYQKLAQYEVR
jgi:pyrroline-5-carboxylate reductase